ncbi:hypothetical protein LZ30DRAFT_806996 [Colletotrichum cereale]|nr:hypothetical protein LZ30DRAFT_806996 [Colletotrichum cereale]
MGLSYRRRIQDMENNSLEAGLMRPANVTHNEGAGIRLAAPWLSHCGTGLSRILRRLLWRWFGLAGYHCDRRRQGFLFLFSVARRTTGQAQANLAGERVLRVGIMGANATANKGGEMPWLQGLSINVGSVYYVGAQGACGTSIVQPVPWPPSPMTDDDFAANRGFPDEPSTDFSGLVPCCGRGPTPN